MSKSPTTFTEAGLSIQQILDLPEKEKLREAQILAKRANTRLKALEKNNIDYGAYSVAKHHLHNVSRETFYEGKLYDKSGLDLDLELKNLVRFIRSKSSTISGVKEVAVESIQARFSASGIRTKIDSEGRLYTDEENPRLLIDKKDAKKYYQFLNSAQFKALGARYDSDIIAQETKNSLELGYSMDDIINSWNEFLNNDNASLDYFRRVLETKPLIKD